MRDTLLCTNLVTGCVSILLARLSIMQLLAMLQTKVFDSISCVSLGFWSIAASIPKNYSPKANICWIHCSLKLRLHWNWDKLFNASKLCHGHLLTGKKMRMRNGDWNFLLKLKSLPITAVVGFEVRHFLFSPNDVFLAIIFTSCSGDSRTKKKKEGRKENSTHAFTWTHKIGERRPPGHISQVIVMVGRDRFAANYRRQP